MLCSTNAAAVPFDLLFPSTQNMFRGLAPVGDGFGMKMLKKMGWREGQPIGKQGEGHVEPICPDIKVDRSGELSIYSHHNSKDIKIFGSTVIIKPCPVSTMITIHMHGYFFSLKSQIFPTQSPNLV